MYLNLIKLIHDSLTANIILNGTNVNFPWLCEMLTSEETG